MLTKTRRAPGIVDLPPVRADSLLALIALANADPREDKIDVGVGVFRDGDGNTPILTVTKEAEQRLLDTQVTKAYLGGRGDKRFAELIGEIMLGELGKDPCIDGVQTPGGCGALRLGFQLLHKANREARVLIGSPTWPNHEPIVAGVGLAIEHYPYYDRVTGGIRFDDMRAALKDGRPGDIVLLHGCCHNPTGADLADDQWDEVVDIVARNGLIPLIDLAYQGFGRGLDEDARGVRKMLAAVDEAVVAQSCDKNFSCYRDRVGSVWIKTATKDATARGMAHLLQEARESWSMPPDHGAAVARIILDDPALNERWHDELAAMRDRINRVRATIAAADPRLAFIGRQFGMFSLLPLTQEQVTKLREDHSIYMADSGRFNVVGMADGQIDRFIAAVIGAMDA